jgi:hypothetical protein
VQLCTVGDPNRARAAPPAKAEWKVVETISEAKDAVRGYLERCGQIDEKNWGPQSGRIWDHQGEIVARFTYHLRCWSPDGIQEIQVR